MATTKQNGETSNRSDKDYGSTRAIRTEECTTRIYIVALQQLRVCGMRSVHCNYLRDMRLPYMQYPLVYNSLQQHCSLFFIFAKRNEYGQQEKQNASTTLFAQFHCRWGPLALTVTHSFACHLHASGIYHSRCRRARASVAGATLSRVVTFNVIFLMPHASAINILYIA